MHPFRRLNSFHDRFPLIGPAFWELSLQYYLTQLLVAAAWPRPYSWLHNTISDLGNTACGQYGMRYVCSPYFTWMNASLIVLGAAMVAGSSLIYHEFPKTKLSAAGFFGMALAGLGTIMVGLFPENSPGPWHEIGAGLPFVFGNLALISLGLGLPLGRQLKYFTIAAGSLAVLALIGFVSHSYLGLGIGGMERLTAYPQSIWLIVFGIYMTRSHYRAARHR